MNRSLLSYIIVLLLSGVSYCVLQAQTATDSLRVPRKSLMEAFDRAEMDSVIAGFDSLREDVSFEDALPQYGEDSLMLDLPEFSEDSLAAAFQRQRIEAEYLDDYFNRFNPNPRKAVWMAALFPGAGQIYNRKYWKLPIIYGGLLALVYGYNWNQRYYRTYQNAYRDLMQGSPNASYLQFLPGLTKEAKIEYAQKHAQSLEKSFKRKKDLYRNYRDYCVVGMLAVYLVSIVDAYVDAALYHFDVSPELDAYNSPTMMVSYQFDF